MGKRLAGVRPRLRVALSRLPALLERGVTEVLREDPRISIVEIGLDAASLSRIAAVGSIDVAVIHGPGASASHQLELRARRVGLVALVDRPTQSQALRLLGAGASCVSLTTPPASFRQTIHATAEGRCLFVGESEAWCDSPLRLAQRR